MPPNPNFLSVLQTRFASLSQLTKNDEDYLQRLSSRVREGQDAERAIPAAARGPLILATGVAGLAHQVRSGARQIVELYLPGDVMGFGPQPFAGLISIALTKTSMIAAPDFGSASHNGQRVLASHLQGLALERQFLHMNHIVRLGRATAYLRVANLIAEFHWRLHQRGLASASAFVLPLTQEHIADALGLSVVHVNRTLQQLRKEKLIRHEPGRLIHVDASRLARAGEFRPPAL